MGVVEEAPEDIGQVIGDDEDQKQAVITFAGELVFLLEGVNENIDVDDDMDEDRENRDEGISHGKRVGLVFD